ncbi:MAG: M1 family aminopeptidase [Bacteroidota bacterium]
MLQKIITALALLFAQTVFSQANLYNPSIDVQHYEFNIKVSDNNDSLYGRAIITVRFTEKTNTVRFDLANINDTGRGMTVTDVRENNQNIGFTHAQNIINIPLNKTASVDEIRKFEIVYKGIPADGLIFSKNKFKHRTIFADNWPNRGRNWIPCKDHLSDKASVDFIVTAPDHYQVVSNGIKIEETNLPDQLRLTHWREDVPLPTKIMVVGIADFAVDYPGETNGIPVSSWIFPEQKEKGFYDYAQALDILPFYIKNVGPYSYKKLANVQSKTIFGGMENAGAIFYSESSVSGTRKSESLLAHEIAHQWFGDAATEIDWPHLWLSEGFATEMTHLYLESKYGVDTLIKSLKKDRATVLAFTKRTKLPVVDTISKNMELLNTNSYQKGGWILQMLRNQLGDVVFWKAVQQYYAAYRGKNASTNDLQKIFEQVSGKNLQGFFTQWLYTGENPTLLVNWSYDENKKEVSLTVTQQTGKLFELPLEIALGDKTYTLSLSKKEQKFSFPVTIKPSKPEPDPGCKLLFEAVVKEETK